MKLIKKIMTFVVVASAFVGLCAFNSKTNASGLTWQLLYSDFTNASYAANNGSHEKDSISYESYQVYQGSGSVMQWQKSKGYIYNTTEMPGDIQSIQLEITSGTFTVYVSSSPLTSASGTSVSGSSGTYTVSDANMRYFYIEVGSATGKLTSITVTYAASSERTPEQEFESLSTVASLNYNYSTKVVTGDSTVTAVADGSGSSFSDDVAANTKLLGLDSGLFAVSATANSATTPTYPASYANLRIYGYSATAGTGSVSVKYLGGNITSVKVAFTSSYATGAEVTAAGSVLTGSTDGIYTVYEVNSDSFTIANTNTDKTQVRIDSIVINVSGEKYEYENQVAQLRFGALISSEVYAKLLEAGATDFGVKLTLASNSVEVSFKDEQGEFTFELVGDNYQSAAVIKNIPAENYGDEITAQCYVVINGNTYYMTAKTYSVKTIAQEYVNAKDVSAYEQHLSALKALAE